MRLRIGFHWVDRLLGEIPMSSRSAMKESPRLDLSIGYELISMALRFQRMLNKQNKLTKRMEIHYSGIILNKRGKMSAQILKSGGARSMILTAPIKK